MSRPFRRITPFLWFDTQAEEAARFYTAIFPNSRIIATTRYSKESSAASGRPLDSVMTVAFELDGEPVTALNGGPIFTFNEALSLVVHCKDQAEIDRLWAALSHVPEAERCGWCKDRFGLSWQIVPARMGELLRTPAQIQAMMQMTKLDIAALEAAGA